MSSTADGDAPGSSEDQAYFRTLEERFLALRGRATLLSPEDWRVARDWHRLGIPAELVVRVMEELFTRQRERRSRRGISSLRYFRAAVEAAFEEQLELAAGGTRRIADPGPTLAERLERLAAALPAELPGGAALGREISRIDGDLEAAERRLAALEAATLADLRGRLTPEEQAELAERIERALGAVRIAQPADEVAAARTRLERQGLRARFGLPVLSLFSPVALGPEEG